MNTIALYKNPKHYPHYTESITLYKTIEATPVNQDLRTGYVRLQLSFEEIMACNYMKITQGTTVRWAWITDVEHLSGDKLYNVYFQVDAWRTFKGKIVLDNQFVMRSPTATDLLDPMLGSVDAVPEISRDLYSFTPSGKRVMVVQTSKEGETFSSNAPLQPSINNIYMCEYDTTNWTLTSAVYDFIQLVQGGAKPENIVTAYSIPYFNIGTLPTASLPVIVSGSTTNIAGWRVLSNGTSVYARNNRTAEITVPAGLTKVKHSVYIVIPEAGVMNVPDELLYKTGLALRQDVDIMTGASNYMLVDSAGNTYGQSLRGASVSSIPIIGDPMDTYISQNQSALTASILGDVASVVMGVGAIATGAGAVIGGTMVASGIGGIGGTVGNLWDVSKQQVNPPAFLGSALGPNFDGLFWVLIVTQPVDNETLVHSELGYPRGLIEPLTVPASGYIQTNDCKVKSDGTVPQWAIAEINSMFDSGLKVE